MKYLEWFQGFIDKYGLLGAGFLLLLLDRIGIFRMVKKYCSREPEVRIHKREGDEGDEHMHRREQSDSEKLLHEWVNKMNLHLEEKAKENVMLGVMKNDIENMKKNHEKTEENVEKLFNLVSGIKDSVSGVKDVMIEMGYGKKK